MLPTVLTAVRTARAARFSNALIWRSISTTRMIKESEKKESKPLKIKSSAPAGTVLKGLSVTKKDEDPVALPEEEYPEWLWDILDEKKELEKLTPAQRAKKDLRRASREQIKTHNFLSKMNK